MLELVKCVARDSEQVLQHSIVLLLLLHDQRVLGVSIEVEVFALEALHVLCSQDDAHALVTSHGDEVLQGLVLKVEHVVGLVDDGEVTKLHTILVHSLLGQALIDVIELGNHEIDDRLSQYAVFLEASQVNDVTVID